MAGDDSDLPIEERVDRSVRRTIGGATLILALLAALAGWAYFGFYTLDPGQAAVLLRFGKHAGTVTREGLHFTLPPPIVLREIVNVGELESESFGIGAPGTEEEGTSRQESLEATMQTSDNNIVRLTFVVQYKVKDAFEARYRVEEPRSVLRDASQAAMREVVGRNTIDGVLSEGRGAVRLDAQQVLQDTLDAYEAGLDIQDVQLQEVQPPPEVRAAFDDVIAASQDAQRLVNEAQGYRNELLPGARGEAAEVVSAAEGYREAKIAEATGAAERFKAVTAEYQKAPEVTKKRLYLETMETVLPNVEKIIIEQGTTNVLPYLPLGRGARPQPAAAAGESN